MGNVIVIGAGIAGLSAAYRIIELGYPRLILLEASDCVGGLSRSIKRDGYTFDLGPHQIHTENQVVIDFLKKVLKDDLMIVNKKASHLFLGRYLSYPLGIKDILFCLPLYISFPCLLSFIKQTIKNLFIKKKEDSFETWIISHFGRKMYEVYFKPYTRKVWGKPPSELDALCAKERVAVQNLLDVLMAAFSKRVARYKNHYHLPHSPYQKIFYYPKYGVGQLSDRMIDFIRGKGGRIYLNNTVSSLVKDENSYKVITKDGSVYQGDYVVSTIPITQLKDMLESSDDRKKPKETLEFRSITFLFLAVKKEIISDNHWIYFPDKDCLFQRVSELKNFSPYLVPKGSSSVCVEIPCDYEDEVWNRDPKELYETVITAMEQKRYLKREDVQNFWVAREKFAYPTNTISFISKLNAIKNYIDTFPNLYSIGRQGNFSYINIDDVMLMGFKTAEQIVNNLNWSSRNDRYIDDLKAMLP